MTNELSARSELARRLAALPKETWCSPSRKDEVPPGTPCPCCGRHRRTMEPVIRLPPLTSQQIVERCERLGFSFSAFVAADGTPRWQGSLGAGADGHPELLHAADEKDLQTLWSHWHSVRRFIIRAHFRFELIIDHWLAGDEVVREDIALWAHSGAPITVWRPGNVVPPCYPPPAWPAEKAWDEALELIRPRRLWLDGDEEREWIAELRSDVLGFLARQERTALVARLPHPGSPATSHRTRL